MKIIFTTLLLTFICNICYASLRPYIGTSIIYANVNDSEYDFVNEAEVFSNPIQDAGSVHVGLLQPFDNNIVVSLQTSRFFNRAITRSVIDKNGNTLLNKSKIISDTLLIGRRFDRFIPSLVLSNTKLKKSLFYKGGFLGSETRHAILYGANLGYFITQNIAGSFIYIAPNKELDLESAFGLSLNYIF